jgi:hypothetical protein
VNFLPIAGRELRVAARRRSTFWLRVAAAITGLLLGGFFLSISYFRGIRMSEMGTILFHTLTWTCLVAGLCSGLFFTSDCLSEEKREGTLGFLFLTELGGYDVVLGKLLATSLRGFYALLAILPVLGITQMMGGITGAQYWKAALALVNALFCSLAAGMLISALSRDSQKALGGTLLVLLLLSLAGPVADMIISGVKGQGLQTVWSISSPGYVLVSASAWGRSAFWTGLLIDQALAWAMFGLAAMLVPQLWQERKRRSSAVNLSYGWKYGGPGRRGRLRRTLLPRSPVVWLVCRERWQSVGMWILALLVAGGFIAVLMSKMPREVWITWSFIGGLLPLLLYLWAASQSCRFFVEAQRSGLMELLLAAPVKEKEIVTGQWRAAARMFGLPLLLLVSVQAGGTVLSTWSMHRLAAQANAAATATALTNQTTPAVSGTNQGMAVRGTVTFSVGPGTNVVASSNTFQKPTGEEVVMTVVTTGAKAVTLAGNLLAVFWFGMWMGMTSRTANLATLKTVVFVQIIPWFVITLASYVVLGFVTYRFARSGTTLRPGWMMISWPLVMAVVGAALALAKDAGFILWSRKRLHSALRERAGQGLDRPRLTALPRLPVSPPPLPPALPAPQ